MQQWKLKLMRWELEQEHKEQQSLGWELKKMRFYYY